MRITKRNGAFLVLGLFFVLVPLFYVLASPLSLCFMPVKPVSVVNSSTLVQATANNVHNTCGLVLPIIFYTPVIVGIILILVGLALMKQNK